MQHEMMPVLVVDDDTTLPETTRRAFEDAGYAVAEAEDGSAGLAILRATLLPTVVMLHRRMGQSSSEAFLQQVADAGETLRRHAYVEITTSAQRPSLALQHLLLELSVSVMFMPVSDEALLEAMQGASRRLSYA